MTAARIAAARATAGHMPRQTTRAESVMPRSIWDAVRHSRRCRWETAMRQSVRTIASADTNAWCGRKTMARPSWRMLVAVSRPTAA